MHKGLLLMLAYVSTIGNLFRPDLLTAPGCGRTPPMPLGGHRRQARPHAPADGRWHMKFHRNR